MKMLLHQQKPRDPIYDVIRPSKPESLVSKTSPPPPVLSFNPNYVAKVRIFFLMVSLFCISIMFTLCKVLYSTLAVPNSCSNTDATFGRYLNGLKSARQQSACSTGVCCCKRAIKHVVTVHQLVVLVGSLEPSCQHQFKEQCLLEQESIIMSRAGEEEGSGQV